MLRLLVLHGPNLNLLGTREESVYGTTTLAEVDAALTRLAGEQQIGMTINPAGYTHTSVAIRDAIAAVALPAVEVHLTNIHQREEFRHKSYIAGVALAQISGFGPNGYLLAVRGLADHLRSRQSKGSTSRPSPRALSRRRA